MRMLRLLLLALAALLAGPEATRGDDLLPSGKPIEQVVDHYVDTLLIQNKIPAAARAGDTTLIRRLTLDLVGRIPTPAETKAFVASTAPDRRVQLVERLLASPGFVRHQAAEFDTMLMAGTRGSVRDYLVRALKENRPWDRIFRELMLPDEKDPARKGAIEFLRQRVKDLDRLTVEVSTTFFGVNVSCAQCHDHPKVEDWKQDHFYGMKAFFARTFDNGGFLAERDYGEVRFKTTKGQERLARMMFLTGKAVETPAALKKPTAAEQKKERELLESFKRKRQAPPPPSFSARAQLVDLVLQPGQSDFFARSIVNRMWHRMFGRGLVMPLDQMHSETPPSHPELMQWLARDLVEHKYDLRRLIRGLVLSKAYARSSRFEGAAAPLPSYFAVARVRPLTPLQLATSLRLATADPVSLGTGKPEEVERRLEALENSARGYTREFDQPGDDFQVSVTEALLFSNSDRLQRDLLGEGGDRLVGRLKQIKDVKEQVDLAVRSVLSRPATADEQRLLGDYLTQRLNRPVEACRQVVWALLTSPEFRFNH